jgi:hypothetical protein
MLEKREKWVSWLDDTFLFDWTCIHWRARQSYTLIGCLLRLYRGESKCSSQPTDVSDSARCHESSALLILRGLEIAEGNKRR